MDIRKIDFKKLLNNNSFLLVLSLVGALFIWYGVVAQDKDSITTIRNVPVKIDVNNSSLKSLKLFPIGMGEYTVDVEIEGFRTVVGSIKPEDLSIEAKLQNVTAPGTYELALEGFDAKNQGVIIKETIPKTISMRFDYMSEKTIPLVSELSGLSIADGYILNEDYVSPTEISIKGPATEMKQIVAAKAKKTFQSPVSQTVSYDVPISFETLEGESARIDNVEISQTTATITLPILKKKEVPVTVDYIGVPSGFDINSLKFDISPSVVELAGPVSTINNLSELHLGYVDIRTLEPGLKLTYSAQLPPGYISVNNIQNIDVTFKDGKIGEKLLNVTDIRIINHPANYDIMVQTKTFYNVVAYGTKEQLDKLTGKGVVAQVDISEIDLKTGTVAAPVDFVIPDADKCWIYDDDYKAVITIREK